jgi:hypothetical protein
MRTSSIKSFVAAVSIAVALAVAVPTAQARPSFTPTDGPSFARSIEDARDGIVRAIARLLKRFGSPTSNAEIAPPLPGK